MKTSVPNVKLIKIMNQVQFNLTSRKVYVIAFWSLKVKFSLIFMMIYYLLNELVTVNVSLKLYFSFTLMAVKVKLDCIQYFFQLFYTSPQVYDSSG